MRGVAGRSYGERKRGVSGMREGGWEWKGGQKWGLHADWGLTQSTRGHECPRSRIENRQECLPHRGKGAGNWERTGTTALEGDRGCAWIALSGERGGERALHGSAAVGTAKTWKQRRNGLFE